MLRYCLIGVSGFARTHYNELIRHHALGLCQIVAATIINQDEEAERCDHLRSLGCRIHSTLDDMFAQWAGKADCCIVPTGIHLHAPMTIAALDAGLHVLLEKPAAATVADVDRMRDAEQRNRRRVFMGFQSMYASETLLMKQIILSGRLGRIREIVSWSLWPRKPDYYARNAWAGRLAVNGTPVFDSPFNNAVAHQLQMILFLAGMTETDAAVITGVRAELFRAKPIESCDTAALAITTESGTPCRFLTTHACSESQNPIIEARGERGTLRWDFHQQVTITDSDGRSTSLAADRQCRERMHAAVRESLSGGNAFYANLDHARAHTQVVNLAHAAGPIRAVAEGHHDGQGVIPAIHADLPRLAAEVGAMPSDRGLAWATTAS